MEKNKLDQVHRRAKELLKNKKDLFDIVMDAVGDLISIQDLNMRIVYQNKAMKETMGAHEGEFCYKTYEKRDFICDDCPMAKAFKSKKAAKALRIGILPDGSPRRFENVAAILEDKSGKIFAGVEICRDVEIKERALDELKKINEIATGRELKMVQLKNEIKELKERLEEKNGE